MKHLKIKIMSIALLAAATSSMAQSLNMSVIAEGVETKEEAMALMSMNCNCIQGYYFGKPVPRLEITKKLKDGIKVF